MGPHASPAVRVLTSTTGTWVVVVCATTTPTGTCSVTASPAVAPEGRPTGVKGLGFGGPQGSRLKSKNGINELL